MLACCRDYAAKWLRHKNPFIDHTQDPGSDTAVLTFEVAFTHVVGMDFRSVECRVQVLLSHHLCIQRTCS